METSKKDLDSLWRKLIPLRNYEEDSHLAFTGFDGFVDKIQRVVAKKKGNNATYFDSLGEFTDHLGSMRVGGGDIETSTTKIRIGGDAPILSNTLGSLGIQTHCLGAMGHPALHPVFMKMHKLCEITSVMDPGENQILEFNDAKIVLSDQAMFNNYDWEYIKTHTEVFDQLKRVVKKAELFALVDWARLPFASSIWRGFLEDMIKATGKKDALFFFHIGDPYKIPRKKIGQMVELIDEFAAFGKVTVSLNQQEASKLWLVLNGYEPTQDQTKVKIPAMSEMARFIFRVFDIDAVIVRSRETTFVAYDEGIIEVSGSKVETPKVLMGGGDNFNAGYCLGLLEGMNRRQCALLGTAASGAFIQNGYSPCIEDVIEYLKTWADEKKAAHKQHIN
ncbi:MULTISPECIES: hypothetical protein [unclassified Imperialibacter]|uniref:hypothetical protein n=1 Tax=unclassified Imperialibacter TaxID=2629706 RepID=UPI00125A19D6|nr:MULTISPECIES: hypothetical protein [unclassified Imperialibacter]CAD5265221.1 conserved hypothetical protein [Imperialibacter sp. 89]CAD5270107.1 conserved hypothetical protein [Imperialibacter sp. 75]VVT09719.1 conserved hypothetical protein [Imperialibacter sp. EC-SDR9]